MSTGDESKPVGIVVANCPCKHRAPPLGTNTTCPYSPPYTCGGPVHCGICRANNPKTAPAPLEPDSIVGWVSGPDGIYEVATSSGQAIPREASSERRPVNQALYRCCEILADAIQSGQWRDKEAALESWRLLRGDVERHLQADQHDRRELVAWVTEMAKADPRIEFEDQFILDFVARIDTVRWLRDPAEAHGAARHLAEQCARAARVTGWREREQS